MIEFDTFCYLQNQKTGCTFVEDFLRKFSVEKVRMYHKHAAVAVRKPGMFYFMNVRNPADVYLSLYNFGLDGSGEILERLQAYGRGDLYARGIEGFEAWLEYVLDAKESQVLLPAYGPSVAARVGLVSYRFLRLACPGFATACPHLSSDADVRAHFARENIVGEVIRCETLAADLRRVVSGPLKHAIREFDAALEWIDKTPPINTSTRRVRGGQALLGRGVLEKLRAREWFLYEIYYAQ